MSYSPTSRRLHSSKQQRASAGPFTAQRGSLHLLTLTKVPSHLPKHLSASDRRKIRRVDQIRIFATPNYLLMYLPPRWTYIKLVSGASPVPAQSSAEWIVERSGVVIAGVQGIGTMDSTTPVTFTNASASTASGSDSNTSFTNQPFEIMNPTTADPFAAPGPLSADGSSFTVSATCPIS